MDSLTHIVMGAAIAQAVSNGKLGRKAMVFGALAATIPDFDVFLTPHLGDFAEWKYHRGFTHSLWFTPLAGALMGLGLWRWYDKIPSHRNLWILAMALAMISHALLDACTIYGTQLLAPFTDKRFEIAAVSIIDPFFTLILLLGLCLPALPTLRQHIAKFACVALGLSVLYLAYGWHQNNTAREMAAAQLAEQNVTPSRITAYTTIFQPWLRRVVVEENGSKLRVGFVSTFSPEPIKWTCQIQAPAPVRNSILATEAGYVFNWFAGDQLSITVTPDSKTAYAMDARYGIPGPSAFGWWGMNFRLNANGSHLTANLLGRIRNERDASLENIKQLFRASVGLPNSFLPTSDKDC